MHRNDILTGEYGVYQKDACGYIVPIHGTTYDANRIAALLSRSTQQAALDDDAGLLITRSVLAGRSMSHRA